MYLALVVSNGDVNMVHRISKDLVRGDINGKQQVPHFSSYNSPSPNSTREHFI